MANKRGVGCGCGLAAAVLIALALAAVFGLACWGSYRAVAASAAWAEQAATALREAAQDGDAEGFAASAASLDGAVGDLRAEAQAWVWDVLGVVAGYGDDVAGARTLLRTVDALLDDVVLPASRLWLDAASVGDSLSVSAGAAVTDLLAGNADGAALNEVVASLQQGSELPEDAVRLFAVADEEVPGALAVLRSLPAFRLEPLNQVVDELAGELDLACAGLDRVRPYIEAYTSARDAVWAVVDGAQGLRDWGAEAMGSIVP